MSYPIVITGTQIQSDYAVTDTASLAYIKNKPGNLALDLQDRSASITLPTVPTVIKPPITAVSSGITYDPLTGIITLPEARVYSTFTILNCSTQNNRTIYTYAEVNIGAGWVASTYSGRDIQLNSQNDGQVLTVSRNLFPAGTQLRFPFYASGTGVNLVSVNLPGTTPGTVIAPAFRLLIAA
jgi:hypothetical protein